MSETQLTNALCRLLERAPMRTLTYPLPGSTRTPPGWPDRMFISNGLVVFCEFKASGQRPSPLQERRARDLAARGIPAWWCTFENSTNPELIESRRAVWVSHEHMWGAPVLTTSAREFYDMLFHKT